MNEAEKQAKIAELEKELDNYEHTIMEYEAGRYKFVHKDANGSVDLSNTHYKDAQRLVPEIKKRLAELKQG